jgi:putative ABC transport system permease protein
MQSTPVSKVYTAAAPDYPFEYKFFDEQFDCHYKTEAKQQAVLCIFPPLQFLSHVLLIWFSLYSNKKNKEIGVRKVLGLQLKYLFLLSKTCCVLFYWELLATPVGYYAMNKWLQSFAYCIDFIVDVRVSFYCRDIALLTVGSRL